MDPRPFVDLTKISISPLAPASVRDHRFDCGHDQINRFLNNKAVRASDRNEARIFLAFLEGIKKPIAYYALQIGSEEVSASLRRTNGYLKSYTLLPSVHLAFVGVVSEFQKQGVGRYIMGDVIDKVYSISNYVGFYALTLQSLNEYSTKFYSKIGFTPYTDHATAPKMLLPIATIRNLVEGRLPVVENEQDWSGDDDRFAERVEAPARRKFWRRR